MHQVAAIQMISGPDVQANLDQAAPLIAQAASAGAKLVLLPECFAAFGSSSLQQIADEEFSSQQPITRFLAEQARLHGIWLIGGSIPLARAAGQKPMACCLVYDDRGQQVARYDKLHLFDVDVADNHRSYRESRDYDFGDSVVCVDTPVGRVGLSICYDLRSRRSPVRPTGRCCCAPGRSKPSVTFSRPIRVGDTPAGVRPLATVASSIPGARSRPRCPRAKRCSVRASIPTISTLFACGCRLPGIGGSCPRRL